jgi:tetratricopeptide (TPR) repeat protein
MAQRYRQEDRVGKIARMADKAISGMGEVYDRIAEIPFGGRDDYGIVIPVGRMRYLLGEIDKEIGRLIPGEGNASIHAPRGPDQQGRLSLSSAYMTKMRLLEEFGMFYIIRSSSPGEHDNPHSLIANSKKCFAEALECTAQTLGLFPGSQPVLISKARLLLKLSAVEADGLLHGMPSTTAETYALCSADAEKAIRDAVSFGADTKALIEAAELMSALAYRVGFADEVLIPGATDTELYARRAAQHWFIMEQYDEAIIRSPREDIAVLYARKAHATEEYIDYLLSSPAHEAEGTEHKRMVALQHARQNITLYNMIMDMVYTKGLTKSGEVSYKIMRQQPAKTYMPLWESGRMHELSGRIQAELGMGDEAVQSYRTALKLYTTYDALLLRSAESQSGFSVDQRLHLSLVMERIGDMGFMLGYYPAAVSAYALAIDRMDGIVRLEEEVADHIYDLFGKMGSAYEKSGLTEEARLIEYAREQMRAQYPFL